MNRKQPIYDNKNLKSAGKYNFDNVNSINRRRGEMEFDHSIEKKDTSNNRHLIITIIISGILLLCACIFAFTDIKYFFFPKKEKEQGEVNFEDESIMHELLCTASLSKDDNLKINIDKRYVYNNNKVKSAEYIYIIEISAEQLLKDQSLSKYIDDSFNDILKQYEHVKGVEFKYTKDGNKKYKLVQDTDLSVLNEQYTSTNIVDTYFNQNIDSVIKSQKRQGFKCNDK